MSLKGYGDEGTLASSRGDDCKTDVERKSNIFVKCLTLKGCSAAALCLTVKVCKRTTFLILTFTKMCRSLFVKTQ